MALFAVGDMLLKYKRDSLPRPYRVPWPSLVLALVAVLFALAVTVARKPRTVVWFALYLGVTMGVFLVTFFRVPLLTLCLHCLRYCLRGTPCAPDLDRALVRAITSVRRATACAFFTKTAKLSVLNKVLCPCPSLAWSELTPGLAPLGEQPPLKGPNLDQICSRCSAYQKISFAPLAPISLHQNFSSAPSAT